MTDQLQAAVVAIDDVEATGQSAKGSVRRLVRLEGVSRTPGLVVAPVLMFLAGSLRFAHVGSAYDVWQDEVNYVDLSISFRHGQFPPRFDGGPFLLYPPLFFALSALWEDLVRTSGSYFDVVDSVRALNIVFAIASTGLLYARNAPWKPLYRRSCGVGIRLRPLHHAAERSGVAGDQHPHVGSGRLSDPATRATSTELVFRGSLPWPAGWSSG